MVDPDNLFEVHSISSELEVCVQGTAREVEPRIQSEIARLWDEECRRRPRSLFDGRHFSVTSIGESRIVGHFVDYSRYIAQTLRPELFAQLAVRPLGVSGLMISPDGVVFGQRNANTTQNQGSWELTPSGGVDPRCCTADGKIDLETHLLNELREEVGLSPEQVDHLLPFALIEDRRSHVVDIGVLVRTPLSDAAIVDHHRNKATNEYLSLKVVAPTEIGSFLARPEIELAPASRILLRLKGLIR